MGLSAHARLLIIGIWTEAFDDGVFDWKPLTLKARIFPVDAVDMIDLLGELIAGAFIRKEEVDGKFVGLIRNFREFQRPKKPNSSQLMQPGWENYVGITRGGPEPVPNLSATGAENSPQMEGGGGRVEEEDEEESPPIAPKGAAGDLFDEIVSAFPRSPHFNEAKAERAFLRLSAEDKTTIHAKALAYAAWWKVEQARRKRSTAEALAFAPPLDKWITEGAWRSFEAAAVGGSPSPDLVVLPADDPLVAIVEKQRGKPVMIGMRGTATLTKAEVERARAAKDAA